MSYIAQETSVAAGAPVELYRFVLEATVWTVTSAGFAIVYQDESYQPAAIRRSGIEQSHEFARNGIDIECARDFPVAQLFAASVVFSGSSARIRCESIFTALKRPGLRAHYQTGCRHALFDPGCGVNNQAYKIAGTVTSVSGLSVTSGAFLTQPSGWLTGGYLRINGVPRMITQHAGDTITLSSVLPGLAAGVAFEAFAGCDRTFSTCQSKFGNAINFGGFPWIPVKNPFAGDAIV